MNRYCLLPASVLLLISMLHAPATVVYVDVVDVGAYECQAVLPVPVAPSLQATYSQVITGFVVGFTGQIGGRPTASRWEFSDGTIVSNQLPSVSHAWAAGGSYAVALRAYNDSFPDGVIATLTIQVSQADTTSVSDPTATRGGAYFYRVGVQ